MAFLLYPATALLLTQSSFTDTLKKGPIYVGSFLLVLGILVFVHEFGHYAVAKLFGVRVDVFSLGFGKRLWGFRRGDTDYRISALPLGGYVKMAGENPMEAHTGDPGEFTSHPRWQRFLIAVAGPTANIILAIAVLTVVYMFHFEYLAVVRSPVDVASVAAGSAAEKAGIQQGDRIINIQGIENPNWEQLLLRVAINPKQPLKVTVDRGGETLPFTLVPQASGPNRLGDAGLEPPFVIGKVDPGLPAEKAGLRPGDTVIAASGKPVHNVSELLASLQQTTSNSVPLTVLRDRHEMQVMVTPQLLDTPASHEKKYRLGMSPWGVERLPFPGAFSHALEECRSKSMLVFELLGKLIEGKNSILQMSGPVGIMQNSGEAALRGLWELLGFMALISLNLAVVNLLPIPILDGGLMLMLVIEGTIRRDIRIEIKERVYQAAFVFLIVFFLVITYFDIAKSFHG